MEEVVDMIKLCTLFFNHHYPLIILYLPKQYTDMSRIKGSMHIMFAFVKEYISHAYTIVMHLVKWRDQDVI